MTFHEEIVAMRARIAKAEAERDTWRTSGNQEKYLEAYSAVEALDLQLEGLRQQGVRNTARAQAGAAAGELPVGYNGPRYRYDLHRAVIRWTMQSTLRGHNARLRPAKASTCRH